MLLQRLTSPFFVACWLLASACTMGAFWQYEFTPGVESPIPQTWPTTANTGVQISRRSLLMFVHPQCGCTKAGIRELQELLGTIPAGKSPTVTFVVLQPASAEPAFAQVAPASESGASFPVTSSQISLHGPSDGGEKLVDSQIASPPDSQTDRAWVDSSLEAICRATPGSQIVWDAGGREAICFGVTTSGTCLLYSASGTLMYSGGLTVSRGHSGPNRGRDLLTQCLLQGDDSAAAVQPPSGSRQHHPTFGCALFSERDRRAL